MILEELKKTVECKVCQGESHLYGVCDFNKNCEERNGLFLPMLGVSIWYHKCSNCGLIFTRAFDGWTSSDFGKYIYNEEYGTVDPDWNSTRPKFNSSLVSALQPPCSFLDYGSGSGHLSAIMRSKGYRADNYDPYFSISVPESKFDFITCFEVFEHTSDPISSLQDIVRFLNPGGKILISTLLSDFLGDRAMDNASGASYISPRNGHITIHTMKSLKTLLALENLYLDPVTEEQFLDPVEKTPRYFIAQKL